MEQSESIKEITTALALAQGELKNVIKTGKGNYGKYAELGTTLEEVRPVTSKHGLAIIQMPVTAEDGTTALMTQLSHKSGEWLRGTFLVRMQQQTPQGQGSAITYARRYALSAILGLGADDDDGQSGTDGKDPEVKRPVVNSQKDSDAVTPAQKRELKDRMVELDMDADMIDLLLQTVLTKSTIDTFGEYKAVKKELEETK